MNRVTYKMVVACHNAGGEPDLFFCKCEVTDKGYDDGLHYDMAEDYAEHEGYEGPFVTFDHSDGPKELFNLFVWESATVLKENQ